MVGNKFKINEKIFNITPDNQKVFTDTSNMPLKKLNDKDRELLKNFLKSLDFENYKAIRGESKPGRCENSPTIFQKQNLKGEGVKNFIPSKIIDIYTKLEVLLGLKLSGHTDTLTEASN